MKTAFAIKKLAKFAKVETNGRLIWADFKFYSISFYDQDGEVICLRACRHNDHDDLQSDYHAGTYVKSLDRAIRWSLEDSRKEGRHADVGGRHFSANVMIRTKDKCPKYTLEAVFTVVGCRVKERRANGVTLYDWQEARHVAGDAEALAMAEGVLDGQTPGNVLADFIMDRCDEARAAWDFAEPLGVPA